MWRIFAILGIFVAVRAIWRNLYGLFMFYRRHFSGSKVDFSKMSTAVITGASDGIGKAYAMELARLGLKRVVLIARNAVKLHSVAEEIAGKYPGVETKVIVADFENVDIYERIEKEMDDIHDLDILVNNVGANINAYRRFDEIKAANIFKTFNINMVSVAMMSHLVVRKMLADKRRGAIINVSSIVANLPQRMILYAPSKSYMSKFSEALGLHFDNDKCGITVQVVEPYLVDTKLANFVKGPFVVTPETYARQSLMTLGHTSKTPGAIRHEIWLFVRRLLPDWLCGFFWRKDHVRVASNAATAQSKKDS